jgi:hypothetical protein
VTPSPELWRHHLSEIEAEDIASAEVAIRHHKFLLKENSAARKLIIMRARARMLRAATTPAGYR